MILVAILTGLLTTIIIRRTTDVSALRSTTRKIHADLLEFRLYFDEPMLIGQAWMNLLRDNLKLLLLFLPAMLILALPMAWVIAQLGVVYGLRPLHPGEATVVTAQLKHAPGATDHLELQSRAGVQVETPPVRILREKQVAWRVRAGIEGRSVLDLTIDGQTIRKSIATGAGPMILSPRRSLSMVEFLLHPEETRLPEGDVAWLAVDYPKREAAIPWPAWFVVISSAAALTSARIGVAGLAALRRGASGRQRHARDPVK